MKEDIEKLRKLKVGDKVVCTQEWTYSARAKITPGKRYTILSINKNDIIYVSTDIKNQDDFGLSIERQPGYRFSFGMFFEPIPLKEIRKEKLNKLEKLNGRPSL